MGILRSFFRKIAKTPGILGKLGEIRIAISLRWQQLCGRGGYILRNLYLPLADGSTTEIDLLYISRRGIFVIESKNYSGYVFGNDHDQNWTVTLYTGRDWFGRKKVAKHSFYNPVRQNHTHIKALTSFLGVETTILSLVIFSRRCELKSLHISTKHAYVFTRDRLSHVFRYIWKAYPEVLDASGIQSIYKRLYPLANQNTRVQEKHISVIKAKLDSTELCPRCGGKLVRRVAKQGLYVGKTFYGCSNYPKCRYIRQNDVSKGNIQSLYPDAR